MTQCSSRYWTDSRERETRLRAVPCDELSNGMVVGALAVVECSTDGADRPFLSPRTRGWRCANPCGSLASDTGPYVANASYPHQDPLEVIETGDWVIVDGDTGTEVHKKVVA